MHQTNIHSPQTSTGIMVSPANQEVVDELWKYDSVKRIFQLPVVESSYQYVSNMYTSLKSQSRLFSWSLAPAEVTLKIAVTTTLPSVRFLPLSLVDSILCKGLDTVERTIPAIKYPPQQMVTVGKEYVSSNVIEPVLKRADSVKQMGLNEASRVGEIAATRLDTALDIADNLVEKYLPDATDAPDGIRKEDNESKTSHAIHHMNRFGKKLQRRLTKRTLMEARALRKGGSDILQALLYLGDLLVRDPRAFSDQMVAAWSRLSEDEPENQVPPANLEQLLALLARETARKFVHTVNYITAKLPAESARATRLTIHYAEVYADYALKIVHLEGVKNAGVAVITQHLEQLKSLAIHILAAVTSSCKAITVKPELDPVTLVPTAGSSSSDPNANTSSPQTAESSESKEVKQTEQSDSPAGCPKTPDHEIKSEVANGSPSNSTSDQSPPKITITP